MQIVGRKALNVRQRSRDWGLKRALHWELMHALEYLGIRVHYVDVGSNDTRPWESKPPDVPAGYVTRVVGFDDLKPFVDGTPELTLEFITDAFANGDECAANFHDGALVGFGFVCRSRARVTDQLDVLIPPGFRYNYKDWTHPDHRRRNLTTMRGHIRFTTLPRPYDERSISYVETHNYPSLLHGYVHPKRRSLRMGIVGWFTILGRQIPFNSRRAKWIGLEFVRKSDDGRRQYV